MLAKGINDVLNRSNCGNTARHINATPSLMTVALRS
jgi:hypothetical protein